MSSYIFGLHEIFTWLCDFSINYKWPGLTWKHVLFTKKVKDLIWLILRWSLYNIQSTITVTNIIFCWYSDVRFTLSWNDITFVIIFFFSKAIWNCVLNLNLKININSLNLYKCNSDLRYLLLIFFSYISIIHILYVNEFVLTTWFCYRIVECIITKV